MTVMNQKSSSGSIGIPDSYVPPVINQTLADIENKLDLYESSVKSLERTVAAAKERTDDMEKHSKSS